MKVNDVVVIGSLNMDLVVKVPRIPRPGETISGGDLQTFPGGKGANQAAAVARLGKTVKMIGRVGNDNYGERLRAVLTGFGVDVEGVTSSADTPTGSAFIMVDSVGENCIVLSPGANARVTTQDIAAAAGEIRAAQAVLLQFEIPMPAVEMAVRLAHEAGRQVILNPAPFRPMAPELLAQIDVLVPNETEASALTGIQVGDVHSAGLAAQALLNQGVGSVIVTLGANGALLATRGGQRHIPAEKVTAVDTTAAGDAFIGGFTAGFVEGLSVEDAVEYAVCTSAIAVTRFGAQTSLPDEAEVKQLYAKRRSLATHP
ncbi:MAG TPA: ribokinase [Anaerolineaceae bacterium]|nr:ribokinase [Anaerolineaceae bacterium]